MSGDESTVATSLSHEGDFIKSTWEITHTSPDGHVGHFPIYRTVVTVEPVRFTLTKGQLHFVSSVPVMHRRAPVSLGVLQVGETLTWAGGVITLHDRSGKVRGSLECYTDPFYSRIWTLDQKLTSIGRPGKRKNELEIDHPTVSREHASLNWEAQNPILSSNSQTALTLVDGRPVGEGLELADGAMVQLGDLLFQFRLLSEPSAEVARLNVLSLGSFQVRVGAELITEKSWRTQAVRWMLARLALEWGRPVPVDVLLEQFWPEMPEEKSRNNLNYTISTLRQILRVGDGPDPILRATGSLQLRPDFLGEHDLVNLQQALKSEDFASALDLYAPYLPGCYLDWAEELRTHLEQQTLQGGLRLLERSDFETVLMLAPKLLQIDPTCQQTGLATLRAHLGRGNPAEAVRFYERFRETLLAELGLPPVPELNALYEQALREVAGPGRR